MKQHTEQGSRTLGSLTATAGAVLLMLGAVPVQAQTTGATTEASGDAAATQTVTVTGIRRGIESAISVKKNSDSIVEAVSAEDIGKLPDNSIAESIARLPGLAAQRVAGRAQEIQIRGLSGQFAGTTFNGREVVSTGDNRAVEFDQYPSELLSAVVVYKTPDAALVGQGLSGTVDLQTVRPLSFAKRTITANARMERNSLGDLNDGGEGADGHRLFLSYIDQFADRTLGVAVGYARLQSPNQNEYYRSWGYPQGTGTLNGTTFEDVRLPGGMQVRAESAKQTRDALMGVIEWKPTKSYTSVLDLYYSKFERVALQRGFEAGLAWSGAQLQNPVVTGNTQTGPNTFTGGVLTSADYVGVKPVFRHDLNRRDDTIKAVGWNNNLKFGDGWTAVTDLSWSKADRKEDIMEQYAGTGPGGSGATDTFTVVLPQGGGVPNVRAGLNYADPALIQLVDSGGWGQDGYQKFPHVTDELKSARLSARKDLDGFIARIEGGFNYTEREKTRQVPEGRLWLNAGRSVPTPLPASMLRSPTSMGFLGMGGILSWDPEAARSLYNFEAKNHRDIVNKNWTVNEKISTAFVKADLDTELFSIPVRGNFGVQVVHADQQSNAFDAPRVDEPSNIVARSEGTSYTDVLPSLNLAFALPADQTIRLGLARQMARPRMDEMRASRFSDVNVTRCGGTPAPDCAIWEGSGGNPQLKPWTANAFDISYEKYFGTKAYVGLAYFYKDLRTYIFTQKINRDFTGAIPPVGSVTPSNPIGLYETPANGQGGSMQGTEFSLSLPGNLFTPVLDGFGAVLSFSLTESQIRPFGGEDARPLPGLSRKVGNVTVYYEKHGFSSRVSYRDRSKFVGEITGFGADREFTFVEPERIIDLQLGYELQSGPAKGLSFLFQVNNATNSAYSTYYNNDPTQTREYTKYGRTYLLGVSYKL